MLNEIRRRVNVAEKRYVVAVVGLTNVGKSTLFLPQRNNFGILS
jgi:ribosome biogenesis GTPase A